MTILTLVPVATSCRPDGTANAGDVAHSDLEVQQVVGADSDAVAYQFGNISGMAVDARDRLYVSDYQAGVIRVFSDAGTHLFDIGRSGSGPGEFDGPCCIVIDARQQLWVRDGGNARYDVFTVSDSGASYVRSIRMAHGDVNRNAPLTFDEAGNLIDIGYRTDPATQKSSVTRFHLDSSSTVLRMETMHTVPADSTAVKQVQRKIPNGVATFYSYQPYGPYELAAHSPHGEYAHALSSRYAIDWRDAHGTLIRHITGDLAEGPPLSEKERADAEDDIVETIKRLQVSRLDLGFDVPAHKQPLSELFFDGSGNLWVVLSSADGTPRHADVWNPQGRLMRSVSWPRNVSLSSGVITDRATWGVSRDSLDVTLPARLAPSKQKKGGR